MSSDYEPKCVCPNCRYRCDPGRCPECGETVPAFSYPDEQRSRDLGRLTLQIVVGVAGGFAVTALSARLGVLEFESGIGLHSFLVACVAGLTATIFARFFWVAAIACLLGQSLFFIAWIMFDPLSAGALAGLGCGCTLVSGLIPASLGALIGRGVGILISPSSID